MTKMDILYRELRTNKFFWYKSERIKLSQAKMIRDKMNYTHINFYRNGIQYCTQHLKSQFDVNNIYTK